MIKKFLIIILALTTSIITAQRSNVSPYSFFGIGYNFSPKTTAHTSMGGIGVAMKEYNYLNFTNPAANAHLRVSTYGLGGLTTFLTLKDAQASQSGHVTSLQYVALGFPLGKKAGFSAGLRPAYSVGYSLLSDVFDANNEIVERYQFTGEGGGSKLFGSFGFYLFKEFSLGLEASYIFGSIENDILNVRKNVTLSSKYIRETTVRGAEFKIGAQYKTNLSNGLGLSTGLALKLPTDLKQRGHETLYSLAVSNLGQESPVDTLYHRYVRSQIKEPIQTVVGVGLGKENKWYVAVNSEFRKAMESPEVRSQNSYAYEDGHKTSIGGYYIPKVNSLSSYWNRVTYRAGLRFERTGLLVNTGTANNNQFTSIKDFGINLGLGLPLPKQLSNLNLGFEYGQRGTTKNNLIEENYFNVRLGLSLNSLNWFKQRKID